MLLSSVLIIEIVFVVITAAASQSEDVLRRLGDTEALVQMLQKEVKDLKSQNMLQLTQIEGLEKQLRYQQQRYAYLEGLISNSEETRRENGTKRIEITPELGQFIHEAVRNIGSIETIRRAESTAPVAFFAKMDDNLEHAGVHQTFVFETVMVNIGNGYNESHGVFVAPVPGVYVFTATLVSFYHFDAHARFMYNGLPVTVMTVSGATNGYDTSSQTIMLMLQKGDKVSIQNADPDKSYIGGAQSLFGGFLLHQGLSFPSIVGK